MTIGLKDLLRGISGPARWLPRGLGRLPYAIALNRLQRGVAEACPGAETWARNSFLTEAFAPPMSDLDVTVYFPVEPSREGLLAVARAAARTRRVFPFLGECNVYAEAEALRLLPRANPFELARDPVLAARLRAPSPSAASKAEAAAFLLRMLDSDLSNLAARPTARARKWRAHFETVGAALPFRAPDPETFAARPVESLVEATLAPLDFGAHAERSAAGAELASYFLQRAAGREPHHIDIAPSTRALLPHRTCFAPEKFAPLRPPLAEVFLAQVGWEIWGLSGQYRLLAPRREEFVCQLDRLARSAEAARLLDAGLSADLLSLAGSIQAGHG